MIFPNLHRAECDAHRRVCERAGGPARHTQLQRTPLPGRLVRREGHADRARVVLKVESGAEEMYTPKCDGGDAQWRQYWLLRGKRQHALPSNAHARVTKHEALNVASRAGDKVLGASASGLMTVAGTAHG
jgi:hypothetical protein